MPIYEYQPVSKASCDYCVSGFEAMQKLNDAALSACPRCGAAVQRQLSAPRIGKTGPSLEPSNLEKHGFTQYRRAGQGVYEKTAGKGPDVITDD